MANPSPSSPPTVRLVVVDPRTTIGSIGSAHERHCDLLDSVIAQNVCSGLHRLDKFVFLTYGEQGSGNTSHLSRDQTRQEPVTQDALLSVRALATVHALVFWRVISRVHVPSNDLGASTSRRFAVRDLLDKHTREGIPVGSVVSITSDWEFEGDVSNGAAGALRYTRCNAIRFLNAAQQHNGASCHEESYANAMQWLAASKLLSRPMYEGVYHLTKHGDSLGT